MAIVINDVLMAVFFLVVGLEIRREIHDGALANLRLAALPVISAMGGVVAPAAVYITLNTIPATPLPISSCRNGMRTPNIPNRAVAR